MLQHVLPGVVFLLAVLPAVFPTVFPTVFFLAVLPTIFPSTIYPQCIETSQYQGTVSHTESVGMVCLLWPIYIKQSPGQEANPDSFT